MTHDSAEMEECLRASYTACDNTRLAHREAAVASVQSKVRTALEEMNVGEDNTLISEISTLEAEVAALRRRAAQFQEGVELWRRKAHVVIEGVEVRQRSLAVAVQETVINLQARADALRRLHDELEDSAQRQRSQIVRDVVARQAEEGV